MTTPHWVLEPEPHGRDGHVLVNHTGGPAFRVEVHAIDKAAEALNPAIERERAKDKPAATHVEETPDGGSMGGWAFAVGDRPAGTIEIRWAEGPGVPPDKTEAITLERGLESYPI